MNAALIDPRTEAEQLSNSSDCHKRENGRKIGIMELAKRIFDEIGYAYLQKTPGNLQDQYNIDKESHRTLQEMDFEPECKYR